MRRKKPIVADAPPPGEPVVVPPKSKTWILWVVLGVGIGVAGAYIFVMYQFLDMWGHL